MDTVKWLIDYVRGEWRVLKGAPAAVVLLVVISFGIVFGIEEWHYSEALATLHATIDNKQSIIDQLQEEHKGASPQVAALQAKRVEIRKQILRMYVQAGDFMRQVNQLEYAPKSNFENKKTALQKDFLAWDAKISNF